MGETEDAKAAFLKYLGENKGNPIDPRAINAANREIELGAKSDFAVVRDEPDRETRMRTYPKGLEFKTTLSAEDLKLGIAALTFARKVIVENLEKPETELLDNPKKVSLFDLEEHEQELPVNFREAFQTIITWLDPNGEMLLSDLPEEINDGVRHFKQALEGLQEK